MEVAISPGKKPRMCGNSNCTNTRTETDNMGRGLYDRILKIYNKNIVDLHLRKLVNI